MSKKPSSATPAIGAPSQIRMVLNKCAACGVNTPTHCVITKDGEHNVCATCKPADNTKMPFFDSEVVSIVELSYQ